MQIQSLTLSNDADQFELVRWSNVGEVTRITNPITVDHDALAVEALTLFDSQPIDDLIVVDEAQRPVGLIDSQDLPKLKWM